MAHHKSAIKRIRRNDRVRVRNRQYIAAVKTAVKKFKTLATSAEASSKIELLKSQFVSAQAALAKAGSKGILHKNNAARRISRLAQLLKSAEKGKATP